MMNRDSDQVSERPAPTRSGGGHQQFMRRCLELARQGAGRVSPNPLVGCVIVSDEGEVLGEGYHEQFGGAHAEVNAVRTAEERAGSDALRRATLYVNLEPCSHHGKTPPCADLILARRVPRVVIGSVDTFPEVAGRGIRRLRHAGIDVVTGVLEEACFRLNESFFHHTQTGLPLVTLKIAQTLDGRVATSIGDSQWITGEQARALVHRWRSELDAVLIGAGTARADDPALTVRHVEGRQPLRIVIDRQGTLPPALKLFSDEWTGQTLVIHTESNLPLYAASLTNRGGRLLPAPLQNGRIDLAVALRRLGTAGDILERPLQSILVEAGPGLATALFRADLVDRLRLFIAPKIVGAGLPSIGELDIRNISEARQFPVVEWTQVGSDMLFTGYRNPAPPESSKR